VRDQGPRDGRPAYGEVRVAVILISSPNEIPASARGCVVSIGNFDGVHLGHQALIARLVRQAYQAATLAMTITFQPHPASILRPALAPEPLVWPEREEQLLRQAGANLVAAFQTGPWLLSMPAQEFCNVILLKGLAVRGMVEGPNFTFGHDRQGTVIKLAQWCSQTGILFEVAPAVEFEGQPVSSSRIRQLLREGRVEDAARLLSRPHRIRGTVGHGAGRGTSIGIPTINLHGVDVLLPLDGVYAALAFIPGSTNPWPAACNLGPNPTFQEQTRKVEAHLIGFDGELRGQTVELDLLARLRSTQRFSTVQGLLDQVQIDLGRTLELTRSAHDK